MLPGVLTLCFAGHRSGKMGEAGEDDIRGPRWKHQVRFCLQLTRLCRRESFLCTVSLPVFIDPESGRPRKGQRDEPTQKQMVSVSRC